MRRITIFLAILASLTTAVQAQSPNQQAQIAKAKRELEQSRARRLALPPPPPMTPDQARAFKLERSRKAKTAHAQHVRQILQENYAQEEAIRLLFGPQGIPALMRPADPWNAYRPRYGGRGYPYRGY